MAQVLNQYSFRLWKWAYFCRKMKVWLNIAFFGIGEKYENFNQIPRLNVLQRNHFELKL